MGLCESSESAYDLKTISPMKFADYPRANLTLSIPSMNFKSLKFLQLKSFHNPTAIRPHPQAHRLVRENAS